jgi:hypothetical protein
MHCQQLHFWPATHARARLHASSLCLHPSALAAAGLQLRCELHAVSDPFVGAADADGRVWPGRVRPAGLVPQAVRGSRSVTHCCAQLGVTNVLSTTVVVSVTDLWRHRVTYHALHTAWFYLNQRKNDLCMQQGRNERHGQASTGTRPSTSNSWSRRTGMPKCHLRACQWLLRRANRHLAPRSDRQCADASQGCSRNQCICFVFACKPAEYSIGQSCHATFGIVTSIWTPTNGFELDCASKVEWQCVPCFAASLCTAALALVLLAWCANYRTHVNPLHMCRTPSRSHCFCNTMTSENASSSSGAMCGSCSAPYWPTTWRPVALPSKSTSWLV